MKKNILILGVSGFLGYHLAKKCLKIGWKVFGVCKNRPKNIRYLKNINYLYLDLSKNKSFKKLEKFSFDYVINLAGAVDHKKESMIKKNHFLIVKNLFNYFNNRKIKSFIQIGSSSEYGNLKPPHSEQLVCKPLGEYGKFKLKSTKYLIEKKNFPVIILRFYQVYGPYQDSNRFISQLIISSLEKKEFKTSYGVQCRDFLYIDDAINAIIRTIRIKKKIKNQIINIGLGKCEKLKKVMELVKKQTKFFKPKFGKITLRKDESMKSYPDIKRAKKVLKWKAKINLNQGIRKTIKFYKKTLKTNRSNIF